MNMENQGGEIQNSKLKSQKEPLSDLKERTYVFSVKLVRFLNTLPNNNRYWRISDQLLRSGTSIGANVAEARSASPHKDFINFYTIFLKSANESKYWLHLLGDTTEANKKEIAEFLSELDEISKIIASSIITLKNK